MAKIVNFEEGKRALPEEKQPPKAGKAGGRRWKVVVGRFLAALVTLVLVVGAFLAVLFRDQLNIDSIRRYLTYQSLERDENGQAEEIFFDNSSTNCFAQVDNSLLVCSSNNICLFSQSGAEYINESVSLSNPVVSAAGSYAVLYDLGGTSYYQFTGKTMADLQKTDGAIYNARVNKNGYLTIITQETGYKGVVTVYDSKGSAKMQVNISSSYVMDAGVSEDGSILALVTIGEIGGNFTSTVTFYDGATGDSLTSWALSGKLAVDLQWNDGLLWLQTDEGAACLDPEAGVLCDWESGDSYLWGYAFCENGGHISAWGKYESGSQGTVTLIDENGAEKAVLELTQRISSFSAAGDYLAVLYTNKLEIYNGDLELYATLEDTAGARQVLMRTDGSALLLGSESASLYVP